MNNKKSAAHYTMDNAGRFFRNGEAEWVNLPCTIKSGVGGWLIVVNSLQELRAAMERHHREKGVYFDLEGVWLWASENERECQKNYSAFIPPGRHAEACQGVYPGCETF